MSEEPQVSGDQMTDAAGPLDAAIDENQMAEQPGNQVPLDALQAERSRRQQLEDENKMIRENMQLLMAQQSQQSQQQKPKDEFEGVSDEDVMTFGEFKKALNKERQQFQMTLEELRMTQKHPDYQNVVTQYLPEVLKQNPGLANSLRQTNDYELAYYLAKNSDAYKTANKRATKNADAERIVQNAQRAGSLSSVGQTSPINEAKRYRDMSDAEFDKLVNQNLGYF